MTDMKRAKKAASKGTHTGAHRTTSRSKKAPTNFLSFRPDEEMKQPIGRMIPDRYASTPQFLAEAVEEKIRGIETAQAFAAAKGAWRDKGHPELATHEDIVRRVRSIRGHDE